MRERPIRARSTSSATSGGTGSARRASRTSCASRGAREHDRLGRPADWTLANVQRELGKPFVGKNMLGAYHMPKLSSVLEPGRLGPRRARPARRRHLDPRRPPQALRRPASLVELRAARVRPPRRRSTNGGRSRARCTTCHDSTSASWTVSARAAIRVRYEELCAEPAGVLREVSSRCGATLRTADPDRLGAVAPSPSGRTTTVRPTRRASPSCSMRSPTRADDGEDDGDAPAELRPVARLLPQARALRHVRLPRHRPVPARPELRGAQPDQDAERRRLADRSRRPPARPRRKGDLCRGRVRGRPAGARSI